MRCENCGRRAPQIECIERVVWRTQWGWPPLYRAVVAEWWCEDCAAGQRHAVTTRQRERLTDNE